MNVKGLEEASVRKSSAGAIAGGVVGALAGFGLLVVGVIWCLRRRRRRVLEKEREYADFIPFRANAGAPSPPTVEGDAPRRSMRLLAPPEKGVPVWREVPESDTGVSGSINPDVSGWTGVGGTENNHSSPTTHVTEFQRQLFRQNTQLRNEVYNLRQEMERIVEDSDVVSHRTSLPRYVEPSHPYATASSSS